MAGSPFAAHPRRRDGGRPARYPRLTEERAKPRRSGADQARLAAVACWLVLALGIVAVRYPETFREATATARANASLDVVDRELGGGNSVLPDQGLMIEARGHIPTDGRFRVAIGERQPGWTDLTAPFAETYARYFLLPRRADPDGEWILCLACDRSEFPAADSIWEGEAGLSLLRGKG